MGNRALGSTKKEVEAPVAYGTEFRKFIDRNAPVDFEHKVTKVGPFIVASFASWPLVWLVRGLDWSSQANAQKLPVYINRTFMQAKLWQMAIVLTGVAAATYEGDYPKISNVHIIFRGPFEPEMSGFDD